MKKLKKVPRFKSEKKEREFWQKTDSTKYLDYSHLEKWTFPNLKLTSKPITIRVSEVAIDRAKIKANKIGMPYQTLLKQLIYKGLEMN